MYNLHNDVVRNHVTRVFRERNKASLDLKMYAIKDALIIDIL